MAIHDETKLTMDNTENFLSDSDTASDNEQLRELIRIKRRADPQEIPQVLLSLNARNPEVRARAADALAEMGGSVSADVELGLTQLLADAEATVRYSAVQAIGALRYKSASSKIIKLLQSDSDGMVQVAAAEALGYLEDPSALPSLLAVLDYPDVVVRRFAACSIGLLLKPENMRDFQQSAARSEKFEEDLVVRVELLIASYRLKDNEFMNRLDKLLFQQSGISEDTVTPILNGIK